MEISILPFAASVVSRGMPRKPSVREISQWAEDHGMRFLDPEFHGNAAQHNWECVKHGHKLCKTLHYLKKKNQCPICLKEANRANARKKTLNEIKKIISSRDLVFCDSEYVDNCRKHNWRCEKCGESFQSTWANIQSGKRGNCQCSKEGRSKSQRLDINIVNDFLKSRGFSLLDDEYKNARFKHRWRCRCGYEWGAPLYSLKAGTGCPKCGGTLPKTIKDAHALAKKRGIQFLDNEFSNTQTLHNWGCECGHKWEAPYARIDGGTGCAKCAGNVRLTTEDAKREVGKLGFKLLTEDYKNAQQKLTFRCEDGHTWRTSYNSVVHRGTGCPECAKKRNKSETICREIFERIFGVPFPSSRPSFLKLKGDGRRRLELDGYNKDLGIAFEHQGIQHYKKGVFAFSGRAEEHSRSFAKIIERDRIKKHRCEKAGVALIRVPSLDVINKKSNPMAVIIHQLKRAGIEVPT